MNMTILTDSELLSRIRQDDAHAFKALYLRLWESLFVFAVKRLGSEADAEDVVQDVFASLWARRHSIEIKDSFEGYLFSAVRYKVIDQVAAMLRNPLKLDFVNETLLPAVNSASDSLLSKELTHFLDQEIQSLPEKMREIYQMYIEEHRSVAEIAKKLSLSEQTVRNQLGIARGRLKKALGQALLLLLMIP